MKKKILILLLAFAMIFGLVGCDFLGGGASKNKEIRVKFDSQGGDDIEDVIILADDAPTLILPLDPSREGYRFTGWYYDAEGTEKFETLKTDKDTVVLYAGWKELSKKEHLVGSWSAAGAEIAFRSDETCTLNISGQEFEGDYLVDGDGNVVINYNSAFGLELPVFLSINGTLNDSGLVIELGGQRLQLTKAKQYNLIKLSELPAYEEIKGIDALVKFDFAKLNFEIEYPDGEYDWDTGEYIEEIVDVLANNAIKGEIALKVESFDFKTINDIKASLVLKIDASTDYEFEDYTLQEVLDLALDTLKEGIKIDIYGGKAYIEYPEVLADAFVEMIDEDEITELPTKVVFDLNELDEAFDIEFADGFAEIKEEIAEVDLQEYVDELNETIDYYLNKAATFGLDEQALKEAMKVVNELMPTETKKGDVTTYTYTQAQFEKAIDDIKALLAKYVNIIASLTGEFDQGDLAEINEILDNFKKGIKFNVANVTVTNNGNNISKVEGSLNVKVDSDLLEDEDMSKAYIEIDGNGSLVINSLEPKLSFNNVQSDYTDLTDLIIELFAEPIYEEPVVEGAN